MKLREMPRLLRTVRHLRYSQIVWRGRYMLERRLPGRARSRGGADASASGKPVVCWHDFPALPLLHGSESAASETARLLAEGKFQHFNSCRKLGCAPTDWLLEARESDRLWVVTLHDHAWAHALAQCAARGDAQAARCLRNLLADWIDRCHADAPGAQALAWNSYAIATRLSWWARLCIVLGKPFWNACPEFEAAFLGSLWQQADYLHEHLEWDLRANHLLRDAVGLAAAGRLLDGDLPRRWLRTATGLAVAQAAEQILPDGGHFERSPMYHIQVMDDLLALAHLVEDRAAAAELVRHWQAMAEPLVWMRHPDGQIPLLNDAALNGTCAPAAMLAAGQCLAGLVDPQAEDDVQPDDVAATAGRPCDVAATAGRPCEDLDPAPRRGGKFFSATGVAVWHGPRWSVFFDVGPIGPQYQPGHGHADTLSLDASFDGCRLFVDPGTYAYDDDARRRYDRSTASHNTVAIDDADSSEVWGIFRAGRRAAPVAADCQFAGDEMLASAGHTGYDHLPGAPRHYRSVALTQDGRLAVMDRISGEGTHKVHGGWLLAPEWHATPRGGGWLISHGRSTLLVQITSDARLNLGMRAAKYHPEFGLELAATRLEWDYEGPLPMEMRTIVAGV